MIIKFTKLLFINQKQSSLTNVPVYNFILGRMFKKISKSQQNSQQEQQQAKKQSDIYQLQKKKMQKQVQDQNQYDFLQRQKDIQLNKDFKKLKQLYKNTIPQGIGKSGFNQLVYWSQNAYTPEQIVQLLEKFNKTSLPKKMQDRTAFLQFVQNVKQTVYLAQTYKILVEYAYFGLKYQIKQVQYWLKIQEKVVRKPPTTQQQLNQLIDVLFVMGNMEVGEIIFSKSEKMLQNKQLTVEQIAKLIIAYFKTSKGQKQWIIKLLSSLQIQINEINSEVLQSILPILKQSKNIPINFDQKLQNKIILMRKQIPLNVICIVANYFGFQKGNKQLWIMLENQSKQRIKELKKQKGKIPSIFMRQLIVGSLSSYKFTKQFVIQYILPEIKAKQCKILYRLGPTTLSSLSKCLFIYQLDQQSKQIQQIIEGLIMKHFQKIAQVLSEDLIHVLKDYTVTRVGSRDFYLFLQNIVNDKLVDLKTQRYTVEALTAIYEQSNLCSTDTMQLLRGMAYD